MSDLNYYILQATNDKSIDVVLIKDNQNLEAFKNYIKHHPEIEAIQVSAHQAFQEIKSRGRGREEGYTCNVLSCYITDNENDRFSLEQLPHLKEGEFNPISFIAMLNAL